MITVKDQDFTADHKSIRRLANEISRVWPTPLVVIHGGGSFGHPLAKKYNIADGFKSSRQVPGFARTHQAMVDLNAILVKALLGAGVPTMSLSPSSFITTTDDRIIKADFEIVGKLVVRGIVPVLFGDAVLDTKKGFTILSGDQLAVRLAISLGASKLIFGVDVDGVYTTNPKLSPEARLIERLALDKIDGFVEIGESLFTDVTGGMLGKVSEARDAIRGGVRVQFVNATSPDVIFKALKGEPVAGTILTE